VIDLRTLFSPAADDPPPYDAVTDRNRPHWLDEGRDLLEQAERAVRAGSFDALSRIRKLVAWISR
jgi:hypothetical protein